MGHFKDRGLAEGIDAERTIVKGRDHAIVLEDLIEVTTSVAVIRMRGDVDEVIKGIVVNPFSSSEHFADIPVHTLLSSVRPFVPDLHAGYVLVAEPRVGVHQSPHMREGVLLSEHRIN